MALQEHLEKLKQGVEVWNKWRAENIKPINLREAHLRKAHLNGFDLSRADLSGADLMEAHLHEADLSGAHLNGADLTGADLRRSDLIGTYLSGANLTGADLSGADLIETHLREADLFQANLIRANLIGTDLSIASLKGAFMGGTTFANIDLSNTIGLEAVVHSGITTLGTDTIKLSRGKIPEAFLRGCGLSDWEIESVKLYTPDLNNEEINKALYKIYDLRAQQPLQVSPLFISYSHADYAFVDKLEGLLNEKGIRFWRDVHHATAGKLEKQIDRAIRQNPTVLLVLSENSIKSDWVQHEVRNARKLEKEIERDVLCPVSLDESWKTSPWPERIMEQVTEYNVLDFSIWNDDAKFKNIFGRLIDGLNLYYKK